MIGILDSGFGGLCLVHKIVTQFPAYDIIYFGDTARGPLGDRSPDAIIRYTLQNTELLLAQGAKMVIITSHTVSGIAGRQIRKAFKVPVLDLMLPTIKVALNATRKFVIGVMASRAIVGCNRFQEEILKIVPDAKVYSVACPILFSLVEEGWLKKPETVRIVKKYLHFLKVRQIDTLILGCNHLVLLNKIIQRKIGKKVTIAQASDVITTTLSDFLKNNRKLEKSMGKQGRHRFLVSDLAEHQLNSARRFYKRNIEFEVLARD